jgi:hypothetical protein
LVAYSSFGYRTYRRRAIVFRENSETQVEYGDRWWDKERSPSIKSLTFNSPKAPLISITDRNGNNIAFAFGRGYHGTEGKWDGAT